jgi:hypothetical protein
MVAITLIREYSWRTCILSEVAVDEIHLEAEEWYIGGIDYRDSSRCWRYHFH